MVKDCTISYGKQGREIYISDLSLNLFLLTVIEIFHIFFSFRIC